MKPEIMVIIPARGGSRGIPRKNVKAIAGKPLIAWSIEAAKNSDYVSRIVVSTDDEEIASVAKKYGAEVLERPNELAGDSVEMLPVLQDVVSKLNPDTVVLLQPTSPLTTTEDIDNAIKIFLNKRCDSVVSVCESGSYSPYWSFKADGEYLKSVFGKKYMMTRRQDLPKTYFPNGAIHIATSKFLRRNNALYTDKTVPYVMPPERSIDIDNDLDFMLAEFLLKKANDC